MIEKVEGEMCNVLEFYWNVQGTKYNDFNWWLYDCIVDKKLVYIKNRLFCFLQKPALSTKNGFF